MKKNLPLILFISVFLFLSGYVFAIELITDANSVSQLIRKIETLPSSGLIKLTFKSKIDDSYQPMVIKVPDGYTKAKSWPLLVVLHGLGGGPIVVPSIDSMVQVGPFGRGDLWYCGIGERDVFECIELAKQIFNIDSNRTYLCGFSMGGAGTFELGLKHPDIWAACVPVCGRLSDINLVENGRNLQFWINAGSEDKVVPAEYSRKAYDEALRLGFHHWKYTEYEGMGHSFWIDWEKIEKWLLSQEKMHSPSSISFTSEKPSKAYWSEIKGKINCTSPARIDVEIASQTIKVTTFNIADYTLYLKDAPLKTDQEITIIENDKQIFQGHPSTEGIFNRMLDGKKTDRACAE
ncbi:MAG: carboxylesterase family protein [Planctomycetota bacterium]|jgi:predicted esterase